MDSRPRFLTDYSCQVTGPVTGSQTGERTESCSAIVEVLEYNIKLGLLSPFLQLFKIKKRNKVKIVNLVDDNPVFDAARVFLDGECQNLVYCCDPKCAEKPTFKRFFRQGSQSSRKNQVFKPILTLFTNLEKNYTNLVANFHSCLKRWVYPGNSSFFFLKIFVFRSSSLIVALKDEGKKA